MVYFLNLLTFIHQFLAFCKKHGTFSPVDKREEIMENSKILVDFKEHLEFIRRLTPQTIKGYGFMIELFIKFLSKPLTEATRDDIKEFIKYRMSKGLSNTTLSAHVVALRSLYNYLADITQKRELIALSFFLNKIVKLKKDTNVTPTPSNKEWERLREALSAFKHAASFNKESNFYKECLRDSAMLEVFTATGMRPGELESIRLRDIDFDNETIFIECGKGEKQRMVIFNEASKEAIKEYLAINNFTLVDKIFDIKYKNMINYIVKKWRERAGINAKIRPHSFRHYHITQAQRLGIPTHLVSNQVGHKDPNTTLHYTHLDTAHRRNVYKMHNF